MALQKTNLKTHDDCGGTIEKATYNTTVDRNDLTQARYVCSVCGEVIVNREPDVNRPIPRLHNLTHNEKLDVLDLWENRSQHVLTDF